MVFGGRLKQLLDRARTNREAAMVKGGGARLQGYNNMITHLLGLLRRLCDDEVSIRIAMQIRHSQRTLIDLRFIAIDSLGCVRIL